MIHKKYETFILKKKKMRLIKNKSKTKFKIIYIFFVYKQYHTKFFWDLYFSDLLKNFLLQ